MEATPADNALAIFGVIVQSALIIAILGGLIYATRKHKVLRVILIFIILLLFCLALLAYFIFKDMGKGWAL